VSDVRALNRALSALVAIALIALGVLLVVEAGAWLLNQSTPIWVPYDEAFSNLQQQPWSDLELIPIFVGLLLLGLLMLFAGFGRGTTPLPLTKMDDQVAAEMAPSDVAHAVEDAAKGVPGVSKAKAKVSKGKVSVAATTGLRDPGDLEARVRDQVGGAVEGLTLARPPRVAVNLRQSS
jgi:hypothetical protein